MSDQDTAAASHDLWIVRHGETEWSRSGRHTSHTDVALTRAGRDEAKAVGGRLRSHQFALVLTSPLSRAKETAILAGFPDAMSDSDLHEWDYGQLEGRTTDEIEVGLPGGGGGPGQWPDGEVRAEAGGPAARVPR